MGSSFTHLHVHTEYSMLDGAARLDELVAAAAADGQPALGITDHGNMYGVLDFYRSCRGHGINPVIGSELYMAHEHRSERPSRRGKLDDSGGETEGGGKLYYHLTALAENDTGYKNLIQLTSRAFMEGYYYKPRVDWEVLAEHSEGIIATTGCLGGHVLQSLLQGDDRSALEKAARLQDIFGRDNLFVELQDHGIPAQHETNPKLLDIARRIQAPILVTNDSHYTHQHDHVAHDALLCVQTGSLISDPNRFKFHGDQHYLKSAAEMRHLFAEIPEACDNTLWIAERAKVEIEFGKPQLPDFPIPDGFAGAAEYLEHLTFTGARERWGRQLPDAVVERLAYELEVIKNMGFSSYFLITWDLIRHARQSGIRVGPGRGSAAGCAVAYCLWITDLDPIKYDLLFERFLNPSRISMPDIDMDFDSRYRDEMIRYAAERYGRDHVAQIVTFSQIKARAAVRDAARVLGYPYAVGDKVAKAMPPLIMGRDTPLKYCFEEHPKYVDGYKMAGELRQMVDDDPDVAKVVEVAKGLEGLRRSDGIHAAAVVITKDPLTTYLPIQRKPEAGQDVEAAPVVTQYEMHGVEDLGLLKMDFLGLRNLDVISDTLDLIEKVHGARVDIDSVPLDDEPTYELLRAGQSIGVFQLEGGPMRALMRSLAPTTFEDIAALVALYRPGPMSANMHNDYADRKNGRKPVQYLHEDAEEILKSTFGLMIYQESVMRIAQKFAGYSLAEADNLRKACLPAGTLVLSSSRGYVPIESLMSLTDRRVQTIDTTSATSRREAVEDVWSVGDKPVYRLTTSTGHTIEATANHPFLVEGRWTELGDVRPGDRVAVAARTHTDGATTASMAEVELAALLISQGHTPDGTDGSHGATFPGNADPELADIFRAAGAKHFGRPRCRSAQVGGVTRLRPTDDELLTLTPTAGRLGLSADKSIPLDLINAPRAEVERFLALYFCADGWADRSGTHFRSASRDVCAGLKRMLLRCGIRSNLHAGDITGHGRHWTLSISEERHARAFAVLASPHLTQAKLDTLDRWPCSEGLEDPRSGDLSWDTVASIEYVGTKECFDFRMANPERPYAVVEDFLVHNCGKKIRELIVKERTKFVEGCEANGYGRKLGDDWFDIIEPFADYAFNKSHSYGYGFVSYQTAFLKANYPVEYLASLLTSVKSNLEKAAVYLNECRQMGIKVLVPDINRSDRDFTSISDPDGGELNAIPFGLSAVRNVGDGLVELILAERRANGPFESFIDFVERVDYQVLNKRTIESLIKAGAFDSLGHPRKGLLLVFEDLIDKTVAARREHDMGVMTLFGGDAAGRPSFDDRPAIAEVDFEKSQRLAFEKEMLGLYVSDHPLMGLETQLRRRAEATIADLESAEEGSSVTVGGVVTGLQRKWTKKGDLMAVFTLEDLTHSAETMVFPRTMTDFGHLLEDDRVVIVRGRVDKRDDQPKLMAQTVEVFEPISGGAPPLRLEIRPEQLSESLIDRLKRVLRDHSGDAPVFIHLSDTQAVRLSDDYCVDTSNGLIPELRVMLGADAVVL